MLKKDGWRKRHDSCKLLIRRLLVWAGIPVDCEVFNLFASCIPQDGLNRLEGGRRRQGLVPDFRVPAEEGGGSALCELKCMSASSTRYPQGRRLRVFKRAVDRRADLLTSEYQAKARQTDWEYCGTPRPPQNRQGEPQPVRQMGPVETKLNSFGRVTGWVFGAWGEASEDIHALVQRLAKARLERLDTLPTVRRRQVSRAALLRGAFLPQKSDLDPLGQPKTAQRGGYGLKTLPITIYAWAPLISNILTPFGAISASKLAQCHQQWGYGGCFRVKTPI